MTGRIETTRTVVRLDESLGGSNGSGGSGRSGGAGGAGNAGGASGSAPSPAHLEATRNAVAPGKRVETSMWQKVVMVAKILLGISTVNNTPYFEYLNDLNSKHQVVKSATDTELEYRAAFALEKTRDVFDLATANVAYSIAEKNRSEPWLGITEQSGVPMSAMLTGLGSMDRNQEAYYHNISLRNWAEAVHGGKNVISFVDKDNTSTSKAMDPSDVVLAQANERLFWGSAILRYYQLIGAKLNTNTARAITSSRIQQMPEGIMRAYTIGMLDSALREQGGLLNLSQLNASDILGIIAFNSGVRHKPGERTMITPELAKTTEFFKDMMAADAPTVNGKRFIEAISDLANDSGYSVLEPKPIPMYMRRMYLDSHASGDPAVYFPHYLKIIELHERIVDTQLPNGKDHSDDEIRSAYLDFQAAVNECISDDKNTVNKDQIWLSKELRVTLAKNPQQFYEYCTKASLSAIVFHHFNNHGTPIENTKKDFLGILEDFSNNLEVRRNVAMQHYNQAQGVSRKHQGHKQVFDFHTKAQKIFTEEGFEKYTQWRVAQYLMHRHSKHELLSVKSSDGRYNLFIHDEINNELKFTDEFSEALKAKALSGADALKFDYANVFVNSLVSEMDLHDITSEVNKDIVVSFLSTGNEIDQNHQKLTNEQTISRIASHDSRVSIDAAFEQIFYPNELYLVNNENPYHPGTYNYATMLNVVLKMDSINPDGQYYIELQPPGEKHLSLPQFVEFLEYSPEIGLTEQAFNNARTDITGIEEFDKFLEKDAIVHVAGDSKGDITMMARALELGGFIDVVLNQVSDDDIFSEIIKQRMQYAEEFQDDNGIVNNDLYQACLRKFNKDGKGMCHLEYDKNSKLYYKVTGFREGGNKSLLEYEKGSVGYTKEQLLLELREKYTSKICHNASPEAFMRRQVEVLGHLTGKSIEFKHEEFLQAKNIYIDKIKGKTPKEISSGLSPEEQELFFLYEYAVIREVEGNSLPDEAPQHNVRNVWKDPRGQFEVYRSNSHDGKLMQFPLDGGEPIEYTGSRASLDKYTIVTRFHEHGFAIYNPKEKTYSAYDDYNKINDIVIENDLVKRPSKPTDFIFTNKWLIKTFGMEKLKKFVAGFPSAFQKLLNWSGSIMALGSIARLISPLFGSGSVGEGVFKTGYYLSNGLRAVSAVGGALRGYLNVNKYWPIPLGEGINIVASFMPDGMKHAVLGLGNFVLFEGRALQAAQRQQRINNPATEILHVKNTADSETLDKTIKKYVDPRVETRNVTTLNTSITNNCREAAIRSGINGKVGEVIGSFGGAIMSGIKMIKDIVEDPRLIFQRVERLAEKSGGAEKVIPSPGHLMGLVGVISGVSAAVAAFLGRSEKLGEVAENGFNGIGRWAISTACAVPALGIIFNALEVKTNPEGLQQMYSDLRGKDVKYNPLAAGTNQFIAGLGFLIVPWFNLGNKYVAALYDLFNGIYFRGAAHEEGPNSHRLFLSMFRSNNQLYKEKQAHRNVSYSQAA